MKHIKRVSFHDLNVDSVSPRGDYGYIHISDSKITSQLTEPYRSDYYSIVFIEEGHLVLQSNFVAQEIKGPSIILTQPHTVKNWIVPQHSYKAESILISEKFLQERLIESSILNTFLGSLDMGVFIQPLSLDILFQVRSSFDIIKSNTPPKSMFHIEIVRGAVYTLVNIIGGLYVGLKDDLKPLRSIYLRFRRALSEHAIKERSISFYAELLHVHPKHLGRVIRLESGVTAGTWIQNQVILESKNYLQKMEFSIRQISDLLNFPDQSTFGKYFKRYAGISPQEYRQQIHKIW